MGVSLAAARLDAIERRLQILEERSLPEPGSTQESGDENSLWALHELQRRRSHHEETREGAVLFTGSLNLPTGESISWQEGAGTDGLLNREWAEFAPALAALGHPIRLEILRHILTGTRNTAELAEIEGLGTTGQLHHHLRELRSAGWVKHVGRGRYTVAAARVVPLLVTLLAGGER